MLPGLQEIQSFVSLDLTTGNDRTKRPGAETRGGPGALADYLFRTSSVRNAAANSRAASR